MPQAAAFRWGFPTLYKLVLLCGSRGSYTSERQGRHLPSGLPPLLCRGSLCAWLLQETSQKRLTESKAIVLGSSCILRPVPTNSRGQGLLEGCQVLTVSQSWSSPFLGFSKVCLFFSAPWRNQFAPYEVRQVGCGRGSLLDKKQYCF